MFEEYFTLVLRKKEKQYRALLSVSNLTESEKADKAILASEIRLMSALYDSVDLTDPRDMSLMIHKAYTEGLDTLPFSLDMASPLPCIALSEEVDTTNWLRIPMSTLSTRPVSVASDTLRTSEGHHNEIAESSCKHV